MSSAIVTVLGMWPGCNGHTQQQRVLIRTETHVWQGSLDDVTTRVWSVGEGDSFGDSLAGHSPFAVARIEDPEHAWVTVSAGLRWRCATTSLDTAMVSVAARRASTCSVDGGVRVLVSVVDTGERATEDTLLVETGGRHWWGSTNSEWLAETMGEIVLARPVRFRSVTDDHVAMDFVVEDAWKGGLVKSDTLTLVGVGKPDSSGYVHIPLFATPLVPRSLNLLWLGRPFPARDPVETRLAARENWVLAMVAEPDSVAFGYVGRGVPLAQLRDEVDRSLTGLRSTSHGEVFGRVMSSRGGVLRGVAVRIGTNVPTRTDRYGWFHLRGVRIGPQRLEVQRPDSGWLGARIIVSDEWADSLRVIL